MKLGFYIEKLSKTIIYLYFYKDKKTHEAMNVESGEFSTMWNLDNFEYAEQEKLTKEYPEIVEWLK